MLEVKFLKKSFEYLMIELLASMVSLILVSPSYFELNLVVIESTNSPNHMVKELGRFGGFWR